MQESIRQHRQARQTAKNILEMEDALLCIRLAPIAQNALAFFLSCCGSDHFSPALKVFSTPDWVEFPHMTLEPQMTLNPACVLLPQMTDAPQITD